MMSTFGPDMSTLSRKVSSDETDRKRGLPKKKPPKKTVWLQKRLLVWRPLKVFS